MAKKKPETAPAANAATESDKIYLHRWHNGASQPVSLQKPLTEHGKKLISDEIDTGSLFEIIDEAQFSMLRGDESFNADRPTDEKHAEVCKLIDYEPLVKKTLACSEYFDHVFTPDEIKQMAMEFAEASAEKTACEEELKSHKKAMEAKIAEQTSIINRISTDLARGKRSENVKCHWVMNDPQRGAKTLYRLDTEPKEFVRFGNMTASDKQLTLEDVMAAKKKTERTLEEKEITPVTNEPYEGEVLTDKEVEDETGAKPETETETETETGDEAAESADDSCPI